MSEAALANLDAALQAVSDLLDTEDPLRFLDARASAA
jgi:hypothetical protein